jgi:hypothetical protein
MACTGGQPLKRYDKLIAPNTFIGRYLQYMKRTETAYAYDFWCALWCLAGACGRNIYVARPRAPVYLNMYLILIGDSGVPRKTTSVVTAGGMVRDCYRNFPEVGYLDAKMTGESLDKLLHERTLEHASAQLAVAIPELAVFMGTEHYIANMPTLLTDLYDCPGHRHGGGTISRGETIQRNVWLTFISASTPVWLLKTVNPNVIEGGFTSRCIFVIANKPKQNIPWPDGDNTEYERDALLYDLREIRYRAQEPHPISLTPGGMHSFTRWYNKRMRANDPYRQSFEAREDAHVLRVAALLCINDSTWEIAHTHISKAIELVASVKDSSSLIFEGAEARTKYATALDTMRSMLISAGMDPVPRSALQRRVRHALDYDGSGALLEVLHEINAVQRFTHKTGERGRPVEYYRGTELLLSRGLGEQVLEKFM